MSKITGICLGVVIALCAGTSHGVPPPPKMSTPTLTCGSSGQTYINIVVTAGTTGAPAGFTVQWETAEDYATYGWDSSLAPSYCDGSFSGMAAGSVYSLASNQSITVNIGDNTFDATGASTSCPGAALQCGHTYVFRAFAHATNTLKRSDFTTTLTCSTLACTGGGCTYTQGYWATHGPGGPDGCTEGNNSDVWPVTALSLGNVSYSDTELCAILKTPGSTNGLIKLAHQLIAAKLNIANGADASAIESTIDAADAMIGSLVVPPTNGSTDSLANNTPGLSALNDALTSYNEGETGPGHCE